MFIAFCQLVKGIWLDLCESMSVNLVISFYSRVALTGGIQCASQAPFSKGSVPNDRNSQARDSQTLEKPKNKVKSPSLGLFYFLVG
jgi:hypothetical protein